MHGWVAEGFRRLPFFSVCGCGWLFFSCFARRPPHHGTHTPAAARCQVVINMGGEMLYILRQRLDAQDIPEEKSRKGSCRVALECCLGAWEGVVGKRHTRGL